MSKYDQDRSAWLDLLKDRDSKSDRDWWITFWLSLILGAFGADRFYLGFPVLGLLKLFTFGGFGLWWLIDLALLLGNRIADDEGRIVRRPGGAVGNIEA